MTNVKLSARLEAVAGFVRNGAVYADIGTDHAYLPAYLVQTGRVKSAVASDVRTGPLGRARETLECCGLRETVRLRLGNGLDGLEDEGLTDISIAGMGGELIASIIEAAPWTKHQGIRLILQPMTRPEELRRSLLTTGYAIIDEMLVSDDRLYEIVVAEYDGVCREADGLALSVGLWLPEKGGALFREHLQRLRNRFEIRRCGKKQAGQDTSEEDALLRGIDGYLYERS